MVADGKHVLFASDRREPWFGDPAEDNGMYAVAADLAAPSDGAAFTLVADIEGPIAGFTPGPEGRWLAGRRAAKPIRSYDQNDVLLFEGVWPDEAPRAHGGRNLAVGETTSGDMHPPAAAARCRSPSRPTAAWCSVTRGTARRASRARHGQRRVDDFTPSGLRRVRGHAVGERPHARARDGLDSVAGRPVGVRRGERRGHVPARAERRDARTKPGSVKVEEIGYDSFDGKAHGAGS